MRREWSKPITLSFSISLVGTASIEPGNDTVVIRDAFARVWQQAAQNALTGNSSAGSFGTVELIMPKKGIEISVLPIPINSSLSRIKKSWMHF